MHGNVNSYLCSLLICTVNSYLLSLSAPSSGSITPNSLSLYSLSHSSPPLRPGRPFVLYYRVY